DQYAVMPSSKQLSQSGGFYKAIFASTVTINTAGGALAHQLQASDPNVVFASTNSAFFTVNTQSVSQLQVLTPGETAAAGKPAGATPAGKTGSPSAETAGQSFQVTVNATDILFNIVSSNLAVNLTSDDS